jgi:asparagine synthase (glutamine-hydrolysing)
MTEVRSDKQGVASTQERLQTLRARVKRLRGRLESKERALEKCRAELRALRSFTLDVFPDHRPSPELTQQLQAIRAEHLTFLGIAPLSSLVSCVLEAEAAGRPGVLIEAGTARGGSAIAMALAKSSSRPLLVYDVFGMIPPPTEDDGKDVQERYATIAEGKAKGHATEEYYGYRDDLLGEVTESFARHGVPVDEHHIVLVQGLFQDTITGDEPVAVAHVDGDWYESTMTCLERIFPRVVPGGRIVIDDYYAWSGCRTAVDEYVEGRSDVRVEKRAKVHLVRVPTDS